MDASSTRSDRGKSDLVAVSSKYLAVISRGLPMRVKESPGVAKNLTGHKSLPFR
jgi:hypothetical protein